MGQRGMQGKHLTMLESIVYSSDHEDQTYIIESSTIERMIKKVGCLEIKKAPTIIIYYRVCKKAFEAVMSTLRFII